MNQLFNCPECASPLIPESGCMTCPCCGWNSCEWELPSTEKIIRQKTGKEDYHDDYRNEN